MIGTISIVASIGVIIITILYLMAQRQKRLDTLNALLSAEEQYLKMKHSLGGHSVGVVFCTQISLVRAASAFDKVWRTALVGGSSPGDSGTRYDTRLENAITPQSVGQYKAVMGIRRAILTSLGGRICFKRYKISKMLTETLYWDFEECRI